MNSPDPTTLPLIALGNKRKRATGTGMTGMPMRTTSPKNTSPDSTPTRPESLLDKVARLERELEIQTKRADRAEQQVLQIQLQHQNASSSDKRGWRAYFELKRSLGITD